MTGPLYPGFADQTRQQPPDGLPISRGPSFQFLLTAATAAADPGRGKFGFSNLADPTLSTTLHVSRWDRYGNDNLSWYRMLAFATTIGVYVETRETADDLNNLLFRGCTLGNVTDVFLQLTVGPAVNRGGSDAWVQGLPLTVVLLPVLPAS